MSVLYLQYLFFFLQIIHGEMKNFTHGLYLPCLYLLKLAVVDLDVSVDVIRYLLKFEDVVWCHI